MQKLFDALCDAIRKELNLEPVLLPQKSKTATGHVVLVFQDIRECGNDSETLYINAEYRSGGTGSTWAIETAKAKRRFLKIEQDNMPITVNGKTLCAHWTSRVTPYLEYPDGEENGGMPCAYVAPYTIRISYPISLIDD
jgi:hypothetical protein|nr:MAG TPA: hypothetical protein [Caudoviricetes sp.]